MMMKEIFTITITLTNETDQVGRVIYSLG